MEEIDFIKEARMEMKKEAEKTIDDGLLNLTEQIRTHATNAQEWLETLIHASYDFDELLKGKALEDLARVDPSPVASAAFKAEYDITEIIIRIHKLSNVFDYLDEKKTP
ncbi:hypothetical protein [Syntrophus aciditrophicus]|uniref:Hypothetical cytosolic protein n=1 Tax=Syntrophus aciditrophicus (strain SB) TaxID=56780 RepID=Q2LV46_SYNAS|nr:hypothetical protein [Syntrophus aciditrophicus]ABC77960.1 hypothetical cytosolic protein [Syntrophus aciditrophicus SB]OPY15796.1 MAG: hypothetical protein A4E74_02112 [Syntrophus sp. PtaB.Bin075]